MINKILGLNIGCGFNHIAGFVNIDKAEEVKPDEIIDIEDGLPFKNNAFNYIYSSHCLEHINPYKWRFVLSEIQRVARKGCVLELKLPFDNIATRGNADHFRTFHWNSFSQFEKGNKRNYYSPLILRRLHKVSILEKIFFSMFPLLKPKWEVHLKYEVVK